MCVRLSSAGRTGYVPAAVDGFPPRTSPNKIYTLGSERFAARPVES